jgi:hypothetical protein
LPPPAKSSPCSSLFLIIFALLCIALSIWADLNFRFLGSESRSKRVDRFLHTDAVMLSAADDKGLFLKFDHAYTTPAQWQRLPQIFYFRAAYLLYPQNVLVDDPGRPINDLSDVMNANLDPSDDWLREHNIAHVLSFTKESGTLQTSIHTVDAPQPATQP